MSVVCPVHSLQFYEYSTLKTKIQQHLLTSFKAGETGKPLIRLKSETSLRPKGEDVIHSINATLTAANGKCDI